VPAQVGAQLVDRCRSDDLTEGLEEFRLGDVDGADGGCADAAEVPRPFEIRRERLKVRGRHLVIDLFGIASGHAIERRLRERRFETHHRVGLLARDVGGCAGQRQELGDVFDVLLADIH
jgi:hypothetical protein